MLFLVILRRLDLGSINPCGQSDKQVVVVGLAALKGGLISYHAAAFFTAVDDNISLLRIGKRLDGAENTAAIVCSVAGINIYVQRAEAEGTMVSRGVAKGLDLTSAVLTDKALVVFCKSFHYLYASAFF